MKRLCRAPPIARCLLPAGCWLLGMATLQSLASAQCVPDRCSPASVPHAAVARVVNVTADGSRHYGSGTLVHKDGKQGIVLSCAHLFRSGTGNVLITFPDGRAYQANLAAVDHAWDLAALSIAAPGASQVKIAEDHPRPGDPLRSCGYGADGRYWCNQGRALGYAKAGTTSTYETLWLSGHARDGDSGGPVFNQRGELVAVVWGTDGRTVGGTYCGRIRRFLAKILSLVGLPRQRPGLVPVTPGRSCPGRPSPLVPGEPLDEVRQQLEGLAGRLEEGKRQGHEREQSWGQRFERIEKAVALVAALKGRIENAEVAVGSENLRAVVRDVASGLIADRAPGLVQTVLPAALAALGWTAPPSIAVILAVRLLAVVLRRRADRRTRRAPAATRRWPERSAPLNDQYARQLAEVYALSGHSPIADATLGREYDKELSQAEQSSDGTLARWARKLRQRVAERFYRIHGESPLPAEPPEHGEE